MQSIYAHGMHICARAKDPRVCSVSNFTPTATTESISIQIPGFQWFPLDSKFPKTTRNSGTWEDSV